jgi:calcineurin-like phosphoesterase family protein
MAKTPNIYFSSDWHFDHKDIINFERNHFASVQEHNDYLIAMIKQWAKKWTPGSTLWFLGDFGNLDFLWVFDMLMERGIVVNFMLGNHDKQEDISKIEMYVSKVYEYPIYLSQKLVISHYPVAVYEDSINVCGHLHGSKLQDRNHIIASIHVADYKPISMQNINGSFGKLPRFNRRFVYEPFAADYQSTQPKDDVIMDKDGRIDLSASRLLMNLKYKSIHHEGYNPYVGGL